jgi:hypothetical protein
LQYFGMKEMNYYTVLFGVSRCLGKFMHFIWFLKVKQFTELVLFEKRSE